MELTILGSGSLVPRLDRGTPGSLLRAGGKTILVDSGSGTLYRLLKIGVTCNDLDILCYTHTHLDHFADFPVILFTMHYGIPPRERDLTVYGGRDFVDMYRQLLFCYGSQIEPELFQVHIEEMPEVEYGDFRITSTGVEHIKESAAFRFDADGKAVVFGGDTDYSACLVDLAELADVLVVECSFPEGQAKPLHLTPTVAGRIAREARVKKLVLVHMYPPALEADVAAQAGQAYDGEVVAATDGLKIVIGE